jgi:hypothetical protein
MFDFGARHGRDGWGHAPDAKPLILDPVTGRPV